MDTAPDLRAEDVVDELVLLDSAASREGGCGHGCSEVIAPSGPVLDLGSRPWDRGLDALSDLLGVWHPAPKLRATAALAILSIAMVTITDKGAEKVREFIAAQNTDAAMAGLRVGVRGGGCSGFQYQLAFDEQREDDTVFESHGLKLLVDGESLPYVRGSVVDYEESLQGAGFKVENPNVVAACGCGSSFRVAEQEQVSAV
jgi:iron-sulfur cluster assembly accessory protein